MPIHNYLDFLHLEIDVPTYHEDEETHFHVPLCNSRESSHTIIAQCLLFLQFCVHTTPLSCVVWFVIIGFIISFVLSSIIIHDH